MNGAVLLNSWIFGVGIRGYSGLWVTSYLMLQIDIWGWCWGLFRVRGDPLPVAPDRYLGVVLGVIQGWVDPLPVAPD